MTSVPAEEEPKADFANIRYRDIVAASTAR